ncbi:MAG: hypothetical protein Q9167_005784 [Letrouitia subvulpina]
MASNRNSMWSELPLPRDYQLLPPVSQALLRAARSGEAIKKPAPQPLVEDEKGTGEDDEAEGDVDTGFVAKRWAPVPRHLEEPEPEFLAKRRRGLPSAYNGAQGPNGTTGSMRKTKVRKLDPEGNAAVLEVLVPEGQNVDGEVFEEETKLTEAPAPGTVVEGVGVANAEGIVVAGDTVVPSLPAPAPPPPPPRRRPPPPKRRPKGPGRGRKKKVAFAPGAEGTDGASMTPGTSHLTVTGPDGEGKILKETVIDGDVEMKDDSVMQNGDESSDDEEEGDEGEEGEEVEEGEEGATGARELSLAANSSKSPAEQLLPPLSFKTDDEIQESSEAKTDNTPVIVGGPSTPPIPKEAQLSAPKDLSSSPEYPLAISQNGDAQRNSIEPSQDDHAQPTKFDDDPTQPHPIDPADDIFVQSLGRESPHEDHFQPVPSDLIHDELAISVTAEPIHNDPDQPAVALPDTNDQASPVPAAPGPDSSPQPMMIDPVQEVDVAPAPDVDRISPSNQVVVEEAPAFEEERFPMTDEKPPEVVIAASLPLHHDPVDGLAPPTPEAFTPKDEREAAEKEAAERAAQKEALEDEAMDQDAHFTDGEVDLLGSLEKQLEGKNSEFHDT